jgi:hypothetical protein
MNTRQSYLLLQNTLPIILSYFVEMFIYSLWPPKMATPAPPPELFSVFKRLFSPSDPFEKTLKTTCLSSDHYQYYLIREERSAYTAYRVSIGGLFLGP